MGTRCQICLHDRLKDETLDAALARLPDNREPGVILYHHSDGGPDFQIPKLFAFLRDAFKRYAALGYSWNDPERVAGMLIFLSAADYHKPGLFGEKELAEYHDGEKKRDEILKTGKGTFTPRKICGYPQYTPCASLHGDIRYLYDIFLSGDGEFALVCHNVDWVGDDWEKHVLVEVGRIDSGTGKGEIEALAKAIEENSKLDKPKTPKKPGAKTTTLQKFVKAVNQGKNIF